MLPNIALAANFKLDITRQDDGITCSELWYNDQVIWRVAFLTDGTKPVSGGNGVATTYIIPDIVDGLFLLKVK
jgi:hypothetical protein